MKPVLRPAAAADVEDAYRWYERQREGLGEEFLASVRHALDSVSENPERYPVLHRQTRRTRLRRFPYGLFYRIMDDQLVVVACMHGRRDPRSWQTRK